MTSNTRNRLATTPTTSGSPDAALLQAVIERRLALRLGVSAPVASVIAALAGLGPQARGGA